MTRTSLKHYKTFLVTSWCRKQMFCQKFQSLKAKKPFLLGHLLCHVMPQLDYRKRREKKRQFNLHPSPCKFYLCKTLGVKPNGIFYSENTTNDVLKHFCRLNNLVVGGKKVELIGRLQAHFRRYGLNADSQLKVLTWTSQGKPLPTAQEVQQIQDTVRAQNVLSKTSQKRKRAENDTGNGDTDIPARKKKNTVDDSMRQSNQLGLHTIIFSNAVASES